MNDIYCSLLFYLFPMSGSVAHDIAYDPYNHANQEHISTSFPLLYAFNFISRSLILTHSARVRLAS